MTESLKTRREFLAASVAQFGGSWLLLRLPLLSGLAACARDAAERGEPLTTFTPEQGAVFGAFAARVIPSDDDVPGATEAGATHFADLAIAGPFAPLAEPVVGGLAALDVAAMSAHGAPLAELTAAEQDAVIALTEAEPWFFPLRLVVIAGVLSDPSWGGNRDGAGWELLDIEHAPVYAPPFGYYDAERARSEEAGA